MKKIVKSEYFYNENGNIERSVNTETTKDIPVCECEEGELLTNEFCITGDVVSAMTAAMCLASVGLCIIAATSIFKRG